MSDTTPEQISLKDFPQASARLSSNDLLYVYQTQYGEVALPAYLVLNYIASQVTAGVIISTGVPPDTDGVPGSYAIDLTNAQWYGPKNDDGTWPTSNTSLIADGLTTEFTATLDASIVSKIASSQPLIVSAAPAASTGVVGQIAIDPTNGIIYGPKTSSGWGATTFVASAISTTLAASLSTAITNSIMQTLAATTGATKIGYGATTVAASLDAINTEISNLQAGGSGGAPITFTDSAEITTAMSGGTIVMKTGSNKSPTLTIDDAATFTSGSVLNFMNLDQDATLTIAFAKSSNYFDFGSYGGGTSTGVETLTLYFGDSATIKTNATDEVLVSAGTILLQQSSSRVTNPSPDDVSTRPAPTFFVDSMRNSVQSIDLTSLSSRSLTTNEAVRAILEFTGVLNGDVNVVLPTRSGTWTVVNNTTGAHVLTLSNGQTNTVTVASQKASFVFSDGTSGLSTTSSTSGFQFSDVVAESSTSVVLDSTSVGKMVIPMLGASSAIELPLGASLQKGASIFFAIFDAYNSTLVTQGTDTITSITNAAYSNYGLSGYDRTLLTWDGSTYRVAFDVNTINPSFQSVNVSGSVAVGGGLTVGATAQVQALTVIGAAHLEGAVTADSTIAVQGAITTHTGVIFPDGTEQYTANGTTAPTISRYSVALGNLTAGATALTTGGFLAPFVEVKNGAAWYTRGIDFTLGADGVTINFTNAFDANDDIIVLTKVIYNPSTVYVPSQSFVTPAANLSTFAITPHIAGFQKLYTSSGGKLVPGRDYTTDGTNITLIGWVTDGNPILFDIDTPITYGNTVPLSGNAVMTGPLTVPTLTITGALNALGAAFTGITGRLIKVTTITATQQFTFQSQTGSFMAYIQAAGGGGGGIIAGTSSTLGTSGNGGGGACGIHYATVTGGSTVTATVGAAGTAGAAGGGTGGNGGNTSFAGITAGGGVGGSGATTLTSTAAGTNIANGNGGIVAGASIANIAGERGPMNNYSTNNYAIFGNGGAAFLGQGGYCSLNTAGGAATTFGYGGGGGGVLQNNSGTTAQPGGVGAQGAIIVFEFAA